MPTHIFLILSFLLLSVFITGCSGYSSAVNSFGPETPASEMREEIEATLVLAEGESPFCAKPPVEADPEMEPAIAALPADPYRARLYFIFDSSTFTP